MEANHLYAARGNGGIQKPNVDILFLVRRAGQDIEAVRHIDVPAGIWTIKSKGPKAPDRQHPIIWEHGGYRTDGSDSMCSVVANSDGGFVPSSHVRRIIHGSTRPNGQQAMVEVMQGTLFSIGHRASTNWTLLFYRVDDVAELDEEIIRDLYKIRADAPVEEMARLSCTLVGYDITGWKKALSRRQIGPELERLAELTRRKLSAPCWNAVNCECWRVIAPKDARNLVFTSEVFTSGKYKDDEVRVVSPDELLSTVESNVHDYRVSISDTPAAKYAVRVQQDLYITSDDKVGMRMTVVEKEFDKNVEFPVGLDQLDVLDVSVVETVFENSIPFVLLDSEPSLLHGAKSCEELHDFVKSKLQSAKGFNNSVLTTYFQTNR